MALLLADLVPLWLASVDTKRINYDLRRKIERYRREAVRVLCEANQEGRLSSDLVWDELLAGRIESQYAVTLVPATGSV